ncbi:penicillin-binding transpeptidase domain-containing protein [Actinoplanes sp. NPDC049599]|uniref:peptidoglycan D,D-transpeptidase FtsI family protein n=1 Tax=Actinoplanes sp. NPDC049599 TaxID=3363903 RepID=UPI0037A73CB0
MPPAPASDGSAPAPSLASDGAAPVRSGSGVALPPGAAAPAPVRPRSRGALPPDTAVTAPVRPRSRVAPLPGVDAVTPARPGSDRSTSGARASGGSDPVSPVGQRLSPVGQRRSVPPRQRGAREPAPAPVRCTPAPGPARPAGSRRRIRLATVFSLALFTAIGVRLVVLQVGQSPAEVDLLLAQQRSRLVEIELPAARGSIVDRSGAVLARSVEARYVYADPQLIEDAPAAAARLSPLLGIAPSRLTRLMARQKRPSGADSRFEYLARGVDIPLARRVDDLGLAGIGTGRDERRDSSGADLASNLIGFTGEDRTGLEGLEARYDDVLRGRDGRLVHERGNPQVDDGRLAKEIPSGYHRLTPARPGATLHLTIDRDLQFQAQRALCPTLARAAAAFGAAVVLDVRTGEVLVQASCPGFNAAKPLDLEPAERADVASSVAAEPGSTHKAFVVAAALQEGVITADTTVPAGGPLVRGGTPFADEHPQPAGTRLTIPEVLAYSSNVGTIAVADRLGPQRIFDYQRRFGLGATTGEGMPGESAGRLLAPPQWSPSATGSVPIGASVDATLLQMAAGYAAIANDGVYVAPRLVQSAVAADGTVTPGPAPRTHRVLSPEVAAEVRTMLEAVVVLPGATGRRAAVPGYRVAGKTGTLDRLVDGRYTSANAVSFIGMAPAEAPRYVVAVSAAVPRGAGGEVAAPVFSSIMGLTLSRYRVPPSTARPPSFE